MASSSPIPIPATPPTVLILGGLPTLARPLALYLSGLNNGDNGNGSGAGPSGAGGLQASFIRIVDRFSVSPPSTYLDKTFLQLLPTSTTDIGNEADIGAKAGKVPVEYKQVNLSLVERHVDVFTPPDTWPGVEGSTGWKERGFEVVYDLTGEMAFDKSELLQISHTHTLALSLAASALSLPPSIRPKAYVRLTYSFYEMKSLPSSSAGHSESSDALRPDGARGRWWHETLRGLGRMRSGPSGGGSKEEGVGLNVGAVRAAAWYGPGSWGGEVTPRIVAGHVYKYLKEDMKFLYNADLRINTIHTTDLSQILHLTSLYLLSHPLTSNPTSTDPAQVAIPYTFTPPPPTSTFSLTKEKRSSLGETWKTVSTVVPSDVVVKMPLFNAVDDGDTTQEKIGKAVGQVWGIKVGYLNSTMASLVQSFAKTDFMEMVEDVNEMHVEAWSKMLSTSTPPIASTPITPYLDEHAFKKLAICLDGAKAKKLLGFKPVHPSVEVKELERIVKGFQDDGAW